jgi:hypothetical protein
MTRLIQIGPSVAFAAIVLSPEWNGIATGDYRPAPPKTLNSPAAVAPAMTSTITAAGEIEQLGLL